MTSIRNRPVLWSLAAILLFALWLRMPGISQGLPYFYDEDEAHHFNRSVNMVKAGDFNPHYFHKPSLHFYLRMPVVATAFLWNVRGGHLRSLKEIITKDSFGIAGYAFSASHPGIAKWNRALSLAFSLLLILITALLAFEVFDSWLAAGSAAFLSAISPALIEYSSTVGVDMLMSFLCVLGIYLAVRVSKTYSWSGLAVCGLICGLAVSSKYNAAPIALIPLIVVVSLKRYNWKDILTAIISPKIGFLIGSPFILAELPLFLDHFAYEIWHYGIAGHEGHTGDPGFSQLFFYLNWLRTNALGTVSFLAAIAGLILYLRRGSERLILLSFPILFLLLMSMQRANFTRNMLVMVPFIAMLAGYFVFEVTRYFNNARINKSLAFGVLAILLIATPLSDSFAMRSEMKIIPESRIDAARWLDHKQDAFSNAAVSGELQFARNVFKAPKRVRVSEEKDSFLDYYLSGHDLMLLSSQKAPGEGIEGNLSVETVFPGETKEQRILKNPAITAYRFKDTNSKAFRSLAAKRATENPKYHISFPTPAAPTLNISGTPCETNGMPSSEGYCWVQSKIALIKIGDISSYGPLVSKSGKLKLSLSFMSPWPDQEITLSIGGSNSSTFLISEASGDWVTFPYEVSYGSLASVGALTIEIAKLDSPAARGLNSDSRRLGVAVKDLVISTP